MELELKDLTVADVARLPDDLRHLYILCGLKIPVNKYHIENMATKYPDYFKSV
jgi:hypothetical protein